MTHILTNLRDNDDTSGDKLWYQWYTLITIMTYTVTNSMGIDDIHSYKLYGYWWHTQWQTQVILWHTEWQTHTQSDKHTAIKVRGMVTSKLTTPDIIPGPLVLSEKWMSFDISSTVLTKPLITKIPQRINSGMATSLISLTRSLEMLISTSWHPGSYWHLKGTEVSFGDP